MTPKQERFIAEYLVDLNATQAAVRAKYHPKMAAQLLAKPSIQAAIAQRSQQQLERLGIKADEAMQLNAEIIRFDPLAIMDDFGNLKPLKDIALAARRCIRKVRVHKVNLTSGDGKTDLVQEYEFYDKGPALDRDYKRCGLQKERVEHEGDLVIRWAK